MRTDARYRHVPKHAAKRGARGGAAAARQPEPKQRAPHSAGREIVEWIVVLGLAVALAYSINTWVGGLVTVKGDSMEPTLHTQERVIVGKVEYYFTKPKRGDIIIIKYPGRDEEIIKRVIATAGERVKVSGGSVYIDGRKLDEPYLGEPILQDFEETAVPEGAVFVMGDNRNNSHDSRYPDVGPIPLDQVLGRAYCVVWPLDKLSKLSAYNETIIG
jgi:signal peptidase I